MGEPLRESRLGIQRAGRASSGRIRLQWLGDPGIDMADHAHRV
ncbi:hypothetical protein [Streptomyces sp. KL118A]|nr:hypothetical protein [Streptomyces sp. KL118A]